MNRPHGHERSRHFNILLILLAIAAVGTAAYLAAGPASARLGAWHEGRHAGGANHGFAQLCDERHEARIEAVLAYVERTVDITPDQSAAWQRLAGAVRKSGATLSAACAEFGGAEAPAGAADILTQTEAMMAAGLDAVRELRPAFDGLYAALDNAQRAALDDLVMHRRHD